MQYITIMVAAFLWLGLRERTHRGSTHVTALVVAAATLVLAFWKGT